MNLKGVCRTALATLGLFITTVYVEKTLALQRSVNDNPWSRDLVSLYIFMLYTLQLLWFLQLLDNLPSVSPVTPVFIWLTCLVQGAGSRTWRAVKRAALAEQEGPESLVRHGGRRTRGRSSGSAMRTFGKLDRDQLARDGEEGWLAEQPLQQRWLEMAWPAGAAWRGGEEYWAPQIPPLWWVLHPINIYWINYGITWTNNTAPFCATLFFAAMTCMTYCKVYRINYIMGFVTLHITKCNICTALVYAATGLLMPAPCVASSEVLGRIRLFLKKKKKLKTCYAMCFSSTSFACCEYKVNALKPVQSWPSPPPDSKGLLADGWWVS